MEEKKYTVEHMRRIYKLLMFNSDLSIESMSQGQEERFQAFLKKVEEVDLQADRKIIYGFTLKQRGLKFDTLPISFIKYNSRDELLEVIQEIIRLKEKEKDTIFFKGHGLMLIMI